MEPAQGNHLPAAAAAGANQPVQVNLQGQVRDIVAGPFNQPLFGQLVGEVSPYDPSARLSLAGWFHFFPTCV